MEFLTEIVGWVWNHMPEFVPALIVGAILYIYFSRCCRKVEANLRIQQKLNQLFVDYLSLLICKKKIQVEQFISRSFGIGKLSIKAVMKKEEKEENPLTPHELTKLKLYLDMAEQQKPFTYKQAEEFDIIARKLSFEQKSTRQDLNWGTLFISFIAGLVLGKLLFDKDKE